MHEQRTPEWYKARLGKITASRVSPIMVEKKDGSWGAGAITLMHELIAEHLALEVETKGISFAMQNGIDLEPEAKLAYMEATSLFVLDVPFKTLKDYDYIGASADSLVFGEPMDDNPIRCAEYKCPTMANHIGNFFEDPAEEYKAQMQLNMLVWNLDECDFVSYNPKCSAKINIKTVKADKEYQEKMIERCARFYQDMLAKLEAVKNWRLAS